MDPDELARETADVEARLAGCFVLTGMVRCVTLCVEARLY